MPVAHRSCLCGELQCTAEMPTKWVAHCHCTLCRRAHGAAFVAFFAIMLGEQLDPRLGRAALWPLVLAGIASVVYWHLSENAGRGDLRPYVVVQFVPMLLVPLMLLLFRSRLDRTGLVWAVLAAYAVAKLFEALDRPLFELTGLLSGHTLKHLAAASGVYFMWRAVRVREVEPGPRESEAACR